MANYILAKTNSTLIIMPNANLFRIWYEPGAVIINQSTIPNTQTYTCTSITFPPANCSPAGIKTNSENQHFLNIYPNPAQDFVELRENGNFQNGNHTLFIFNALGQLVNQEEIVFNNPKTEIKTANLESGVYLLTAKKNTEVLCRRFVIAR